MLRDGGVQMSLPVDVFKSLPKRIQFAIGLVLLISLAVAAPIWLWLKFVPEYHDIFSNGNVEVSAYEWNQAQEDKRHAGQTPTVIYNDQHGSSAWVYPSGCILVKDSWGSRVARTWVQHPSESEPPPAHEGGYGGASAAGFLSSPQCAPYEQCWQPLAAHPGIGDSRIIGERGTDSRCWVWRARRIADGCVFEIAYNRCTNERDWSTARWLCCQPHKR